MENKKQLIIIPPMSEALKKLNEVLDGITGDENVEISIIDDLKELSQFIASTGQCLILASNAKKCATFLQDNKAMLAKSHCKTILFTPKEIPAKTLIKFTKIGLTESILESSPPKTFLYKVKLLLRSIKTAKPQEDAEKLVKSLETSKAEGVEESEREVKEKLAAEENVIDMETGKKKRNQDSGETIDYGNPLKGKIKPQEESIDTNWKSDRKKHAVENTENENMAAESELASIDMYYRGKRKKIDDMLEPVEDDLRKLKKSDLVEEAEASSRKSNFSDVIDEGSIKQKKFDLDEALSPEEKKSSVELDLMEADKKNKKSDNEEDDYLDLSIKSKRLVDIAPEAAKTREVDVEDLGGYLKGKISKDLGEDLEPEAQVEKDYDNSELPEDESSGDFDLDLLAGDVKKKKKEQEESLEDNVHEGEVDQIDGNMIGNEGTVDKIRTRMNGEFDPDNMPKEKQGTDLSYDGKKEKLEESIDEEEEAKNKDSLDLESAAKKEREKATREEEELNLREAQTKLNLLQADKEKKSMESNDPEDRERQRSALLEKIKEEKERNTSAAEEKEEKDQSLRSHEGSGIKEKKERNQTHDAKVNKIDTFYRGGDSKKTDQNWDNLTDKKTNLELLPGGPKNNNFSTEAKANKDHGEMTIDYRKLKEEFDMMSSGGFTGESGAFRTSGDTNLRNNDDDGSFKVVEIDPKSLDFSIAIINSIYNKDLKAKQIFSMITDELVNNYHCYPVFYTYKLSDKKFTEVFSTFSEVKAPRMTDEKVNWWSEYKKNTLLFEHFQSKSMTTWRCPEIVNEGLVWEDVELPTWAEQELKTKQVELIFPYFDGLDRMGLAVAFFPEGLDPKAANGLLTVLEMARTLFLDTIQRYQVVPVKEKSIEAEAPKEEEKKNVLSFFGGLFGKRKAG